MTTWLCRRPTKYEPSTYQWMSAYAPTAKAANRMKKSNTLNVMRRGPRTLGARSGARSGTRGRVWVAAAERGEGAATTPFPAVASRLDDAVAEASAGAGAIVATPDRVGSPGETDVGARDVPSLAAWTAAPAAAPSLPAISCSPTTTSSTTTVMLSLPPASLAISTSVSAASSGSRVSDRTLVISSTGTSLVSPSEHSR